MAGHLDQLPPDSQRHTTAQLAGTTITTIMPIVPLLVLFCGVIGRLTTGPSR
jgi:hypothetical protein